MAPRTIAILINVLGGVAVLGSYAHGIATHPQPGTALWGGVPEALRPLYQASMLSATVGYLLFSYVLLLRTDPAQARVGRFGYGLFHALYPLILVPAALWMPLTFAYLQAPSPGLWLAVRGVLLLTGAGALGMIAALFALTPPPRLRPLAVLGAVAFAVQTALLDALVWPAYFRG